MGVVVLGLQGFRIGGLCYGTRAVTDMSTPCRRTLVALASTKRLALRVREHVLHEPELGVFNRHEDDM